MVFLFSFFCLSFCLTCALFRYFHGFPLPFGNRKASKEIAKKVAKESACEQLFFLIFFFFQTFCHVLCDFYSSFFFFKTKNLISGESPETRFLMVLWYFCFLFSAFLFVLLALCFDIFTLSHYPSEAGNHQNK